MWSTDWFRDPYGQTQLLKQYLHDTLAQKVTSMPPRIEWEADVAAEDHREVQVMESLAINIGEVDSNSESEARIELPDEDMPKWSKEPDVEATGHGVAAVQPQSSANIGVDLAEPIQIGSKVAIRYLDGAKAGVTARFWLADVPDGQSISLPGFTVLKAEAPLAQALIDSVPGEIVSYPLNTGTVRVEVLEDLTT